MSDSHAHHGHSHGPGGHNHAPADFGRAFAIGTVLNLAFVAVEGAAGFITGSVALLADAGHNLSDVLGLLIAWGGAELAKLTITNNTKYHNFFNGGEQARIHLVACVLENPFN